MPRCESQLPTPPFTPGSVYFPELPPRYTAVVANASRTTALVASFRLLRHPEDRKRPRILPVEAAGQINAQGLRI